MDNDHDGKLIEVKPVSWTRGCVEKSEDHERDGGHPSRQLL